MEYRVITSAQNATVKRLRQLATSAKVRRESSNYIAEGIHLVRALLQSGGVPELVVCADSALTHEEVGDLMDELEFKKVPQIVLADSLFETVASVHAGVGIAVVFTPVAQPEKIMPLMQGGVLLEDVQDPGNLGTILRTAAAAGVQDIVLSSGCASPWSPKALRAGMGAQFSVRLHEQADLMTVAREVAVPVMVTTLSPQSQPLYEMDLTSPVVWVFGNEGQGVSQALAALATTHVSIPQAKTSVESLNVAAATAICLYEQYRQQLS